MRKKLIFKKVLFLPHVYRKPIIAIMRGESDKVHTHLYTFSFVTFSTRIMSGRKLFQNEFTQAFPNYVENTNTHIASFDLRNDYQTQQACLG